MTTLSAHIAEINRIAVAWASEGPARMVGLLDENEAHWAEVGVTTPEEFDEYMDMEMFRNVYKSATGCNPSEAAYLRFKIMTPEDRHIELESWNAYEAAQSEYDAEIEEDLQELYARENDAFALLCGDHEPQPYDIYEDM